MNGTTLEAPTATATLRPTITRSSRRSATPPAPRPVPGRTRRGPGRGTGPEARPARLTTDRGAVRPATSRSQACRVAAPAPQLRVAAGPSWRLTDRGIALVLVTGVLIVTAALAVVGLTALRVTGDRYQAAGSTVLATS